MSANQQKPVEGGQTEAEWLDPRVLVGDCRVRLKELDDNSVDAVVTDPPYGISFMLGGSGGVTWDRPTVDRSPLAEALEQDDSDLPRKSCRSCESPREGSDRCSCEASGQNRTAAEDMRAFQRFCEQWGRAAHRVLKPGAFLLVFGSPRTYHRLVCGLEDAGFEIRDSIAWLQSKGWPKSLDVSKAIDEAAGAEREVIGVRPGHEEFVTRTDAHASGGRSDGWDRPWRDDPEAVARSHALTAPATAEAARWDGWGTALKPAFEPIVVARKPLKGTVVANVLTFGTGAMNVDAARIHTQGSEPRHYTGTRFNPGATVNVTGEWKREDGTIYEGQTRAGRWPANVLLSHVPPPDGCRHQEDADVGDGCVPGCAVAELDRQSGVLRSGEPGVKSGGNNGSAYGTESRPPGTQMPGYGDEGGASRFFTVLADEEDPLAGVPAFRYQSKAPAHERPVGSDGTRHPTVKPLSMVRWLLRLVTPPGGIVLDPFLGSGTTAEAAVLEGVDWVGCESHVPYLPLIQQRLERAAAGLSPGTPRWERSRRAEADRKKVSDAGQLGLFG